MEEINELVNHYDTYELETFTKIVIKQFDWLIMLSFQYCIILFLS